MCGTTKPEFHIFFERFGTGIKLLAPALLALHGGSASAQEGSVTLEEILVTAQKRESTLQDASVAVSAFTGDNLELLQINNAMDMQMSVPNMLMTQGNFASANIIIRGIGNNAVSSASDSGTGVHFNGMYLKAGSIFESEFYDTERIEVLRGPQVLSTGAILGQPFPEDDYKNSRNSADLRVAQLDADPEYAVDETMVVMELNHAFERYNFTVLGGYRHTSSDIFVDASDTVASEPWPVTVTVDAGSHGSFTGNRSMSLQQTDKESDQWSAEARLASAFGGDAEFLLGAFWLNYELDNTYTVSSSSFELAGDTFGIPEAQRRLEIDERPFTLDSWALFGELLS